MLAHFDSLASLGKQSEPTLSRTDSADSSASTDSSSSSSQSSASKPLASQTFAVRPSYFVWDYTRVRPAALLYQSTTQTFILIRQQQHLHCDKNDQRTAISYGKLGEAGSVSWDHPEGHPCLGEGAGQTARGTQHCYQDIRMEAHT
jgi:hypothetical protein